MPLRYKTNILALLKEAGFSTYRLRKEHLLGEGTIQRLRNNEVVSIENISVICQLTGKQPGEILEFVPSTQTESQQPQ